MAEDSKTQTSADDGNSGRKAQRKAHTHFGNHTARQCLTDWSTSVGHQIFSTCFEVISNLPGNPAE